MSEFVATSLARRLIARMEATHERRRISVFAGPPGIGKTTAIDEFARRCAGKVVVVKAAKRNAREVLVLQHTLEAFRQLTGSPFQHVASSLWELRSDVFNAACAWAGADPIAARRGEYDLDRFPHLTLVFDEAQNLSREAIEALRYWNDADRCYAPFPLGLVFVGNNEFSLAGSCAAESVVSAAVADRALYLQTFDYDDVADDDLELFIEAKGEFETSAVAAIVRSFRGPRSLRSLRRLSDLLDELRFYARGRTVTPEEVRRYFALA
jgi:DNA transposition AAA+ family ATPase